MILAQKQPAGGKRFKEQKASTVSISRYGRPDQSNSPAVRKEADASISGNSVSNNFIYRDCLPPVLVLYSSRTTTILLLPSLYGFQRMPSSDGQKSDIPIRTVQSTSRPVDEDGRELIDALEIFEANATAKYSICAAKSNRCAF